MISIQFSLYPLHSSPLPVYPLWWHSSESIRWCHLYCVITQIYFPLIKKGICDRQNISVRLPCVYVCLSTGDLFIFLVRVSSFFTYVTLSILQYVPFHIEIINQLRKIYNSQNSLLYFLEACFGRYISSITSLTQTMMVLNSTNIL